MAHKSTGSDTDATVRKPFETPEHSFSSIWAPHGLPAPERSTGSGVRHDRPPASLRGDYPSIESRSPVEPPLPSARRVSFGDLHNFASVRMLVVDDCTLQRENLVTVLCEGDNTPAPAVAWDLPSVLAVMNESPPDIALLSMTTRESIALLHAIRGEWPQAKVIVVGLSEDDESDIINCAEAGVAGYHLRTESLFELLSLISKVVNDETICSPKVSAILLRHLSTLAAQRRGGRRDLDLTAREMQILKMLDLGMSNRDIAEQLCITLHTVKNHVHAVLRKLGVSTRAEAAALHRASS